MITREQAMDQVLELVGKHVASLTYEAEDMRRDILAVFQERERWSAEAVLFRAVVKQNDGLRVDLKHILAVAPDFPVHALTLEGYQVTFAVVPLVDKPQEDTSS